MTERKLSVTITGPEGMLEAMAKLLRDEGWRVREPGAEAPDAVQITNLKSRLGEIEGLMRETIQLWHEWSTTDITDITDGWVTFSDRALSWLARARVAVPDPPPVPKPRPRKKLAPKQGRRR